jgi:DNA-binding beta-propeller fold protein YncE
MNERLGKHSRRTALRWILGTALLLAGVATATAQSEVAADLSWRPHGKIVVADRGSGTLTVIAAGNDAVIATLDLPPADDPPEPMYVNYTPIGDRFFVGDRANDRVVAFNADTLEAEASIPCGAGVFHQWTNSIRKQLWVNNDIDNTSTVIDLRTLEPIVTVPMPADLIAAGGKPHDVIFSPSGLFAYVTIIGVDGEFDYVVQYTTWSYRELHRAAVGGDPHVSVTWRNNLLYVPCQDNSSVYILDRWTLDTVDILDVPGAHGAGMRLDGRYFYTTNLPGGGTDAIWTIDTKTNQVIGDPVDTPYAVPHNIAITPNGRKIYITHSGPNNKVSVYRTWRHNPIPALIGEVTTGDNPFGLAWIP